MKIDKNWEIVYDGQFGYIGQVWPPITEVVMMGPVYHYVSNPNIRPDKSGVQLGENMRLCFPLEMMASDSKIWVRWTRRIRIADFDDYDQAVFEKMIGAAMDVEKQVRLSRSGLQLVSSMPKGMQ